ncbi:uncharacterized [Tachysurus ichikawai]
MLRISLSPAHRTQLSSAASPPITDLLLYTNSADDSPLEDRHLCALITSRPETACVRVANDLFSSLAFNSMSHDMFFTRISAHLWFKSSLCESRLDQESVTEGPSSSVPRLKTFLKVITSSYQDSQRFPSLTALMFSGSGLLVIPDENELCGTWNIPVLRS